MRSAVSSTSSACCPAVALPPCGRAGKLPAHRTTAAMAARLLIVGRRGLWRPRVLSASGRERDGQERAALVQVDLGGLAQLDADLGPSLYLMWDHALDGPAEEPGVQGPPVVGHRDGRVGQVEEHGAIRQRDPVL